MGKRSGWETIAVLGLPLAFALFESGVGFASSPDGPQNGTMAKRLHLERPKYPGAAEMRGREGWVTISFVVATDGVVKDAVVDGSSGVPAFETAAIRAVEKWRYEAATLNGKAVEQCHNRVEMSFQLEGPPGAGRGFVAKYQKVSELIEQ